MRKANWLFVSMLVTTSVLSHDVKNLSINPPGQSQEKMTTPALEANIGNEPTFEMRRSAINLLFES